MTYYSLEGARATAVQMLTAARAHCYNYLLHRFVEAVANADKSLQPVLTKVRLLDDAVAKLGMDAL